MSPRTWGWTAGPASGGVGAADVPTHVGVDRPLRRERPPPHGCPHARGGGPRPPRWIVSRPEMSPRTWGWTTLDVRVKVTLDGCPHARGGGPSRSKSAGGYTRMSPRTWGWTRTRHLVRMSRRDVPTHVGVDQGPRLPRTGRQGCPHARGGGPAGKTPPKPAKKMSPRTWGWTPAARRRCGCVGDVPTHVGVDRATGRRSWRRG